jgi:hypothetical protein
MKKIGVVLQLLVFCYCLSAQDQTLVNFVAEQQEKLIYSPEKLVQAPNTNVFMIPPEHFIADPSINGFVHPGSACTIQVIEIPNISYNIIENSMTPEYIISQNYSFAEKLNIKTENNKNGVIYFVRFISGEMEFERAMFFTGDQNTIWINFNYPLSMKDLLYPAIEACLTSVQ